MGSPGLELIESKLPKLRRDLKLDFVIAQSENVSNGRGCSSEDFNRLKKAGVDFCTGGNWSLWEKSIIPQMSDPNQPIIRPANYPTGTPGLGWKYIQSALGKVLVVSLLGQTVGRDSRLKLENPLKVIDQILESEKNVEKSAIVVNFHGDFSSEKIVIGHYLDGRVSAVIGDHWHVPTADGRILPKGTAHLTDVGMVGALNSSLGVKTNIIVNRWRDDQVSRNELELSGPFQFNGFVFEVDTVTGLAERTSQINLFFD